MNKEARRINGSRRDLIVICDPSVAVRNERLISALHPNLSSFEMCD